MPLRLLRFSGLHSAGVFLGGGFVLVNLAAFVAKLISPKRCNNHPDPDWLEWLHRLITLQFRPVLRVDMLRHLKFGSAWVQHAEPILRVSPPTRASILGASSTSPRKR